PSSAATPPRRAPCPAPPCRGRRGADRALGEGSDRGRRAPRAPGPRRRARRRAGPAREGWWGSPSPAGAHGAPLRLQLHVELAAGGIDVEATAPADHRLDPLVPEPLGE